jgi:glucose/arabinose dehydrogenase
VTAPRSGDLPNLYVVEQEGQVYKLQGGTRTLFLDIRSLVSCCGERGLLGIAFDPQFATNDLLYVNYTNVRGDTRVARYRANASHTGVLLSTRRLLFALAQPASNHNGGRLQFGPNGRLYTGQGDGGGSCDPAGRAQNLRSRHGKLLSLNPRNIGAGWRIAPTGPQPVGFSFTARTGACTSATSGRARGRDRHLPSARQDARELRDAYEGRAKRLLTGRLREPGARSGRSVYGPPRARSPAATSPRQQHARLRGFYYFADFCSAASGD